MRKALTMDVNKKSVVPLDSPVHMEEQYTWEKSEVKGKFILEISPYSVERLSPREIMERRTKFHLKLVNILKTNPSSEMIHECDFPAEPVVEPVQSAAQVLENSRHLFEITPITLCVSILLCWC